MTTFGMLIRAELTCIALSARTARAGEASELQGPGRAASASACAVAPGELLREAELFVCRGLK
jgi:hypothetical protein